MMPRIRKYITVEWAEKQGACALGVRWFKDRFGQRALVEDVIRACHAIREPAWAAWLLEHVLPRNWFWRWCNGEARVWSADASCPLEERRLECDLRWLKRAREGK